MEGLLQETFRVVIEGFNGSNLSFWMNFGGNRWNGGRVS